MSRASFLDRSPEVSLPLHLPSWIRWWLKRKLKRNPLSFSAEVPRLPLRSTSLRAIPVWALSPTIVPHHRFQMNVPRENGTHIEARATPRKATSALVHFMEQLPSARASRPSPGSCWYFGEKDGLCVIGESLVSPLYLSCPPNELHTQCHGRGDAFLVRLSLNQRPAKHLSKTNVD